MKSKTLEEVWGKDPTAHQRLKALHVKAAEEDWDDAVAQIRRHLIRNETRLLTTKLLTISNSIRFNIFGGDRIALHSYPSHACPHTCAVLETVNHFVGHEVLDDGEPGIGYMRHDMYKGFVPCKPTHKDAKPYFHRNIDLLRRRLPDAKLVNIKEALEVIAWHEQKEADMTAWMRGQPDLFDEEEMKYREPTPLQLQMQRLVEELIGE